MWNTLQGGATGTSVAGTGLIHAELLQEENAAGLCTVAFNDRP